MNRLNKRGFTLVELLLATAFFSFILLFVLVGFMQVTRSYNKGIITKRVHESTRLIVEDISRSISTATSKSASANPIHIIDSPIHALCVGGTRYQWTVGYRSNTDKQPGFRVVKDSKQCNVAFTASDDTTEMLDDRLTVQDITLGQPVGGGVSNAYIVRVTVSVNDKTLVTGSGESTSCNIADGDQFCDVATLTTVVTLRN